jgi:alkylhydroperoxidase family enzyme
MPSNFRIPKAELTGPYAIVLKIFARRTFGEIPDAAYTMGHHKPMFKAVMGFEGKVSKWKELDPSLSCYAQLATAAVIGCSWCLDFGYFMAHNDGLALEKVREVPRWRDSDAFTAIERAVLEYAEAMTVTPPTVTDEMVAHLNEQLGTKAVVELSMMVAIENERSRFNSALGLASQGFSERCELAPLAAPTSPVRSSEL